MQPFKKRRQTLGELKELQRLTASAIMRPLTADFCMQSNWIDGRSMGDVALEMVKPNDRLTAFERLEIYNRQYWYRLIDVLYDDWPGMRAVLGEEQFKSLVRAYIEQHPSGSFTLRNLGRHLPAFLDANPGWGAPHHDMALDMARFEWAQTVAFDAAALPAVSTDDLLGRDPATLRLGLQPYVTLLKMNYPLDAFSIKLKKHSLRGEASNAAEMDRSVQKIRKVPLPRRRQTFVAVHRHRNALFYKRLAPEAFGLLSAVRDGIALAEAVASILPQHSDAEWAGKIRNWFVNWTELGWFLRR